MSLFDNHFASKNAASARAWAMDDEKKKKERQPHEPAAPKMGVCDRCHKEAPVRSYRTRQTDVGNGAASFGTVIKYFCEECAPKSRRERDADVPQLDKKQVRNLMRSAKKGLL
ncbi:MAG: hypothetical protein MJY82_04370 [Fibrobacter sp.]|nr:hypothetical protein [Fibrobacter sp.]